MFPFDQMKRLKHSSLLNSVHLKLSFQIIKYFEVQVELLCLAFLFLSGKLLQLANHSPAWNTTLYYCITTRKLKERLNAVKLFSGVFQQPVPKTSQRVSSLWPFDLQLLFFVD